MPSEIDFTIEDGGLGVVAPTNGSMLTVLGATTQGTANTLNIFGDIKTLTDTAGAGPAVEQAAFALKNGAPVVGLMKTATSVASVIGAVTKSAGAGFTIVPSGTPNDDFSVVVKVPKAGAVGTATIQISLDGGDTFGAVLASAASVPVTGTGLTLGITGTAILNETHTFSTTAAAPNAADVGAAIDALQLDNRDAGFLKIVGLAGTAATQMALATAVETEMLSWEDQLQHTFAIVDMPPDTDGNLTTAIASASFKRVVVAAGYTEIVSAIRRTQDTRPLGWALAPRVASVDVGRDPAERALGKLRGVVSSARDEQKTPGLAPIGYTVAAKYRRKGGVYLQDARIPAGSTSDYQYLVHRRIMDLACNTMADAMFEYVARRLKVDQATGFLLKSEADAIDANLTGKLQAALLVGADGARASAATFRVNRTDNVLSTNTLRGRVSIVPLLYPRLITVAFSFSNPALAVLESALWRSQSTATTSTGVSSRLTSTASNTRTSSTRSRTASRRTSPPCPAAGAGQRVALAANSSTTARSRSRARCSPTSSPNSAGRTGGTRSSTSR